MRKYVILIAILSAFPPLSTDMYLPALPELQQLWHQPLATVNLTLISFLFVYCFGMLFYGPISDRVGRRRPLMLGISFYVAASLACALAGGVWSMVGFRALQAAGAAAGTALALAIAKDLFQAEQRAQVIAYVSVILALAPMLAPILGGWIMAVVTWHYIFVAQAAVGAVALVAVWLMPEPLTERSGEKLRRSFRTYARLLTNRRFMGLNLATAILSLPFFAFIAGSADIYITRFGLSETTFGYFFAFNALSLMSGSYLFSRLARLVSVRSLLTLCFGGMLAAGLAMCLIPHTGPWSLALPNWVLGFCVGLSRPPATNLILEQVDTDTGSASSLIAFSFMLLGSLGMFIVSLGWTDKIMVIGALGAAVGVVDLLFWLKYRSRYALKR
ncbi:MAG: multidrug effflux MFS transporter [Desulfarculaceae bacterium]|nr:multidrug effflux MFS transporter [Desulfarculaceae bacterium]